MNQRKYYIVSAEALPEIFIKVAEAKRMLQVGEAATVGEAARKMGISRSAFYKYRDSVIPFQNMMTGRVITFQLHLQDRQGLLSHLLTIMAEHKANLQMINSIVPTGGSAILTITAETIDVTIPLEELLELLGSVPGVIKAEIIAG